MVDGFQNVVRFIERHACSCASLFRTFYRLQNEQIVNEMTNVEDELERFLNAYNDVQSVALVRFISSRSFR